MIPINKPFLPPKADYDQYLQSIWDSCTVTNNGPLVNTLESKLAARFNTTHLSYVNNGTVALQIAIKTLGNPGEIITTPFSFVATTSSIVWEKFTPVYCDIDKETLNIDSSKIEKLITSSTKAILATHVYGNPCDVKKLESIGKKYDIPIIYDAAHAFDVKINDVSVFKFGDISTCSLHATKFYHTIEGGFVVSNNFDTANQVAYSRNFGFLDEDQFQGLGINGKNSELHAAMGLANLPYIEKIWKKRKRITELYDRGLADWNCISQPRWHKQASKNYAYYPIILDSEKILVQLKSKLQEREIYTRRYFYPALNQSLPYISVENSTPISNDISKRVLCLPLFFDLSEDLVKKIIKQVNEILSSVLAEQTNK